MSHAIQKSTRRSGRPRYGCVLGALAAVALAGHASAQLVHEWDALHDGVDGFFFGFNVPVALAIGDDGSVYVNASANRTRFTDMLTIKYAPDGTQVWERIFDGPSGRQDSGKGITIDSDGNILVIGQSECDFLVIKYDATDGSVIWTNQHDGGECPETPNAITTDDAGNIYVTGYTWPPGDTHQKDFYTYKMDSDGNVLWTATYDGPGPFLFSHDVAVDIALDSNGDVLVTGPSIDARNQPNFTTIKYRASDGAQQWISRVPAGGGGESVALIISPEDDVYVTGSETNGRTPFTTVKLSGIDGSQMWISINRMGFFGVAFGMALDSQGDVYVTGRLDPDSDRSTANENVMTMRLRADDGVRQWLRLWGDSRQGRYDEGLAIAIDAQDHVMVSGATNSFGAVGSLLLQYDAATGQIVDQGTFQPGNVWARGLAMTLDAAQNIVVAGMTKDVYGFMDVLTLRYPTKAGCPADLDGDGDADADDFFDYLDAFAADDLEVCDIDGDGDCDADDFFGYLDLFAKGC